MLKFMFKQFMREPLWFKILIAAALLISIIFSSAFFSYNPYYEVFSKLAAAIFFCTFGIKFRRSRQTAVIFFAVTAICIYLSWQNFELARL